jgi:hypothetical protein
VLVVGDGAVGLSFAVWAKILGSPRTVIAGHHQSRLDHGLKLGLDAAVNTTGMTLAEAVPGEQFDIIIDAVGDGKIVEQAMAVVAGWGVIAVYGASMKMQSQVDMLAMPVGASLMRATTNEPRAHPQVLAAEGLLQPRDPAGAGGGGRRVAAQPRGAESRADDGVRAGVKTREGAGFDGRTHSVLPSYAAPPKSVDALKPRSHTNILSGRKVY